MDLLKAFHNPDAKLGSSVFDLSCRRVFSSKAGQLCPALVFDTVPGDKFKINMSALMRSNTMDTAAFVRGKFNYDFFFVPYQQLWHRFLEFVNQKVDLHTSNFNGRTAVSTPVIKLRDLLHFLALAMVNDNGNQLSVTSYPNDLGSHFSACDSQGQQFALERSYVLECFKLLNLLGYGDFSGLLDYIDEDNLQDVINDTGGFSQYLDDMAGDGQAVPYIYINPFRLAAYQHIWYDIYRNKYFDVPNQNKPFEMTFNFDNQNCSSFASAVIGLNQMLNSSDVYLGMLQMHYCQWKKDIYTSLMPSQQYGAVSSVDVYSGSLLNTSGSQFTQSRALSALNGKLYLSSSLSPNVAPNNWTLYDTGVMAGDFDVLALRRAEAMQKWKESALRAGNMSNDNQRAHFGVDPYYYEENEVHFLGSFDGVFQVNPVTSTASSATSLDNHNLGDLAATGTSVVANGHDIEFDCRDYGIIMCIERFVPESEYSATGIEKSNTRFEPFDYYNPEFANLGLQAVPLLEQDNNAYINADKNFVLGYAPRDYDYKQMQDKVYGEFMNIQQAGYRTYGYFANWVAPRREQLVSIVQGSPRGRGIPSFYVNPKVFDRVFLIASDYMQMTDQFLHQCWFDVKAIRKMPVLGLPEF